jgi:DNA-binding transcriptional LysR family regulator
MNWGQVGHFLAIVDAGSFTRAAAAIPMAQPSLSLSIRNLERSLGTPLFDRSGGRVRLTAAGEAFLGPARQLQRDTALARAAVRAVAELEGGALDLVALPGLAIDPLAPLLGRFHSAHPGVAVRVLAAEDPAELVRLVRDGRAELGVTDLGVGDDPEPAAGDRFTTRFVDHDLDVVALGGQDLLVAVPARGSAASVWAGPGGAGDGGPDRVPRRLTRGELADLAWVVTPPGTSSRAALERAVGGVPRIAVEVAQRDALPALVAAGAGAALLPRATLGPRAWGCHLLEVDPPIRRSLGLVRRPGPASPAATALVELAAPRRRRSG